jgi:membrane associated rhomboid family serine protease
MRIGLWIAMAIALYITFRPGVSVAGHAGGLVTGLLLGLLIRVRRGEVSSEQLAGQPA